MKIIDLAEKQKNNETLPKHIRYENEDLYFDGVTYYDKEGNNDFLDILAMNNSALTHLYDEVEVLEEVEDKEYDDITELEIEHIEDTQHLVMKDTINALIRNQKKILERLDK